jgi:hypothetical protein
MPVSRPDVPSITKLDVFQPHFEKQSYTKVVRLEVFTAVTMKNGVFWDVTPCGSCTNRRFGGT